MKSLTDDKAREKHRATKVMTTDWGEGRCLPQMSWQSYKQFLKPQPWHQPYQVSSWKSIQSVKEMNTIVTEIVVNESSGSTHQWMRRLTPLSGFGFWFSLRLHNKLIFISLFIQVWSLWLIFLSSLLFLAMCRWTLTRLSNALHPQLTRIWND